MYELFIIMLIYRAGDIAQWERAPEFNVQNHKHKNFLCLNLSNEIIIDSKFRDSTRLIISNLPWNYLKERVEAR